MLSGTSWSIRERMMADGLPFVTVATSRYIQYKYL